MPCSCLGIVRTDSPQGGCYNTNCHPLVFPHLSAMKIKNGPVVLLLTCLEHTGVEDYVGFHRDVQQWAWLFIYVVFSFLIVLTFTI